MASYFRWFDPPAKKQVRHTKENDDFHLDYCVVGMDMSYVKVRPLVLLPYALLANGKESRPFSFQNTREGFDALISWLMECRRGLPLVTDIIDFDFLDHPFN